VIEHSLDDVRLGDLKISHADGECPAQIVQGPVRYWAALIMRTAFPPG
jgi:hypothetical protein